MSFTTVQFLLKRLTRFFFYSQNIIQIKLTILSMSYYKSSLENIISRQAAACQALTSKKSLSVFFLFPLPQHRFNISTLLRQLRLAQAVQQPRPLIRYIHLADNAVSWSIRTVSSVCLNLKAVSCTGFSSKAGRNQDSLAAISKNLLPE